MRSKKIVEEEIIATLFAYIEVFFTTATLNENLIFFFFFVRELGFCIDVSSENFMLY